MATELLPPAPAGSISDLSARFDALAARIRRVALLKGLGRLVLVVVAFCGLGLLADWLWPLPAGLRIGWLVVMLAAAAYTIYSSIIRPVFRQFTIAELAAVVETEYPELAERLTSAVELTDPNIPEEHKGSALMREWLEAETMNSTEHIDFRKAVSNDEAKKSAWAGAIAVAIVLLPFLLMASGYASLWARLVTPWGAHELPGELYFEVPNGDRVAARGEDLTILALPPKDVEVEDLPEAVELVWTNSGGETNRRAMEYQADAKGYLVTLPHVFEGFEYIVTARRKRSQRHSITVVDRPEITAFTLKIKPPAYTGRPEESVDGAVGNVTAFERSRIKVVLEFNKPLKRADWIWQPAEGNQTKPPIRVPFELSKDGKSAELEILATGGGFAAEVMDEHGLGNLEEAARILTIVTDQPPELSLSGQIGTTRARKDDVIQIGALAKDDFGVSALELHLETPDGEIHVHQAPNERLGASVVDQPFEMDLAKFALADGESIKYRVRAADNRPIPGPQEVWSDERRIIIDPEAELPGSDAIVKRQNELRDVLNAILADLRASREKVEKLREEAESARAAGKPFDKQAELTNLELQQADLADRLEELAARFGQHRLFANLTPETQRIAREPITDAGQRVIQAQEAPDTEAKAKELTDAKEILAKAEADLQKVSQRFDELAELERDLMVVPRLAQQAKRVADQAMDLAKRRDNPPANETPEQKAARNAELDREEAALDEERRQLTDALDELLKARPEVLEAARKTALEQIAELSKQAGELADRQDLLTKSLKTDAKDSAKAASELTEKGNELLKKADDLAPKPASEHPKSVNPIDPEELKKVLEALKAGNLDAAANRQAAIADRLDALAVELKKNQKLPADPKAAAAELAARQRDLQKELEEAVKNQPAEDATAPARDSFQQTLQNLAEKQTGIQAGISQLDSPAPQRDRQQDALDQSAKAVENLLQSKPKDAAENAKQAAKALEELAKNIGTLEERKEKSKEAALALRKKQNQLAKDVKQAAGDQASKDDAKIEQLAKRQREVAEELARLDAPGAEETQKQAIRRSAHALADLDKKRLQDAEASQERAEQAIADLANQLEGKPTSRKEVESLKKRQAEINDGAEKAAKNGDKNELAQQAAAQAEQAERLEKLDTPAAESERQSAIAAAKQAAESLQKPADQQQAGAALDQAAKSLNRLEKALAQDASADPARDAEDLSKRQNEAAKTAQNAAANADENKQVPKANERRQQKEELAQLAEDAKRLKAGEAAAQEKQNVLESLKKAAEAQEKLEELIKKKQEKPPAGDPNQEPAEPMVDEELQRLIQENAEAQEQAAQALDQLKQELKKDENQEKLDNEMNEAEKLAEKLAKENQPEQQPQSPDAGQIEQLAKEARELQKEIKQLKQERAALEKEQVAQAEPGKQPRPAQPSESKPTEQPGADNQDPNRQRPNDQTANDQNPKPSDPNNRDPKSSDPNGSRPEQSPAPMPGEENSPPAPKAGNDTAKEQPQPKDTPKSENQPASENNTNENGQPANPQRADENEPSLTKRQAEMARKSAELAIKVARDQGAESSASRQATESAKKAGEASQQTQDGALEQAAKTAKEAAEAAKAAADELAKDAGDPNNAKAAELAKEAGNQSEAQSALADELAKAASDPSTRQASRQAGQQRLADTSEKLADQLKQAARELTSQPLDLEKPGEKTEAAGQAAGEAAKEMKQAKANAAKGNAAEAARAGEQAAEALRRAAGESPAPPADTPKNTLVPGDLAEQVADARRRLEEAREQLKNARQGDQTASNKSAGDPSNQRMGDPSANPPGNNAQPMPGQNSAGQDSNPMNGQSQPGQSPMGQGNQGQSPANQGQQGQSGQGQSGQPSALSQSAQSLEQAAQALSQAAQQLGAGVPGNNQGNTPGQSSQAAQGNPGQPSSSAGDGQGSQSPIPFEELEAEIRRQNREEWGQLPGQLKTEILEGNKKKPGGDYARLIKLYSEELLKKQQAE